MKGSQSAATPLNSVEAGLRLWPQVYTSPNQRCCSKGQSPPCLPPSLPWAAPPHLSSLSGCWNSTGTNLADPFFADLVFRRIRFSFIWECVSAVWNHKEVSEAEYLFSCQKQLLLLLLLITGICKGDILLVSLVLFFYLPIMLTRNVYKITA